MVVNCNVLQSTLIQPSDNQLSFADFDVVRVIGKGNGGIVHLVHHKWTNQFYALKVFNIKNFHTSWLAVDTVISSNRCNTFNLLLVSAKLAWGWVLIRHELNLTFAILDSIYDTSFLKHSWFWDLCQVIQTNVEESTRKHIARELKINQSAAQSPYIVVCYQSFYENGAISIVLEYMDGGSLADFLKKVTIIPEPYLAAICKQVLFSFLF